MTTATHSGTTATTSLSSSSRRPSTCSPPSPRSASRASSSSAGCRSAVLASSRTRAAVAATASTASAFAPTLDETSRCFLWRASSVIASRSSVFNWCCHLRVFFSTHARRGFFGPFASLLFFRTRDTRRSPPRGDVRAAVLGQPGPLRTWLEEEKGVHKIAAQGL